MAHEIVPPFAIMVGLIGASGFLLKMGYKAENSVIDDPAPRLISHGFDYALLNRDNAIRIRNQRKLEESLKYGDSSS